MAAIWHGAAEVQVHTHCHNASRPQRNPTFGNDGFFTLESTKARVVQGLRVANDPEEIFKRATERGFKVHEVKLAFVCARTEVS